MEYKSNRIINRKPKWVIVDENGKIIDKNPSKYKLTELAIEFHKRKVSRPKVYSDKELLSFLKEYYSKTGKIPTAEVFRNNQYPSVTIYIKRFGSWQKALSIVGLDVESTIKKGIIESSDQKARLAELIITNHFKNSFSDLAGVNRNSPCDGICPNGKIYEVKSSKLHGTRYLFNTSNKYKEEIEIYYLLGFNEDYTKLMYAWRVPGEMVEGDTFSIGKQGRFILDNMKDYEISQQIKEILNMKDHITDSFLGNYDRTDTSRARSAICTKSTPI